ncbi:MAG: SUF system Fe-S cluster assembly protein [Acetobacteraceae bacterium]|jgi:FeS assembly SUF system protein|nr:SUF system Fe-S cluster assembly protein [Acetobacteraceae bacterium]
MNDHPQGSSVHEAWTPEGEQAAHAAAATPHAVGEEAVVAACATVYDPEIPVNIYELGLIYAIEIEDDGRVRVEMTLTAPGCPSAQELPEQVRGAVLAVPGVTSCDVDVVWDPPWTPERMSDEARLAVNMF